MGGRWTPCHQTNGQKFFERNEDELIIELIILVGKWQLFFWSFFICRG